MPRVENLASTARLLQLRVRVMNSEDLDEGLKTTLWRHLIESLMLIYCGSAAISTCFK